MKSLDRKVLRDLWKMKGQAVAIALVIASGVATYVLLISNMHSLTQTRERFYQEVRKAVDKPGATTILDQEGQLLAVNGPKALDEFRRTETAKWTKIISQLHAAGALEYR